MYITCPGFTIRPVRPNEYGAVLDVYRQCEDFLALGPEPCASPQMVEADLRHSREDGGIFCGIFDPTGQMVGVVDVVLSGFEGSASSAFLSLLMIAAPYRSRGLGRQVVEAVEDIIRQNPAVTTILAGVQVNNPAAIRFWQRQGYAIVGQAQDLPDGTTAYPLRKEITSPR